MITEELVIQEAISRGIEVSEEEIDEMVAMQREIFEDLEPSNINEQWFKDLMTNRIRITGLTDDEFWSSDFIRNSYKRSIYGGKLMSLMLGNKEVNSMEEFYQFEKDLYSKIQSQVTYNEELLEEINNLK